jgi:hypothetical protein
MPSEQGLIKLLKYIELPDKKKGPEGPFENGAAVSRHPAQCQVAINGG